MDRWFVIVMLSILMEVTWRMPVLVEADCEWSDVYHDENWSGRSEIIGLQEIVKEDINASRTL